MTAEVPQNLLKHYFSDTYSYNELLELDGSLRPHWQTFFQSFSWLSPVQIQDRNLDCNRFLKENGVTYNVCGEHAAIPRTLYLDIVPFLISVAEWKKIEAGLIQRANLFDLISKGIYG